MQSPKHWPLPLQFSVPPCLRGSSSCSSQEPVTPLPGDNGRRGGESAG